MKGVVYRIYDNTNGNVYYGSTIQTLSNRIAGHRTSYKKYLNGTYHYVKSIDIIKNGDYSYNIVEEVEFETKYELHNRERYYIENNECVNKFIPNRTIKEYREDNKDKMKEYRENNKDKFKQYMKEYYEDNKNDILEKQKEYNEDNKNKIKEYREENKDKIKQYYEDNKNKILERHKEKITCECGCIVSRNNLSQHKKTKKHIKLISTK